MKDKPFKRAIIIVLIFVALFADLKINDDIIWRSPMMRLIDVLHNARIDVETEAKK